MTTISYPCQNCGITVIRAIGDEGRGKFCSSRCSRLAQRLPTKAERFWAKVSRGDGCWEWTGHRNHQGYGLLYTGPRGSSRQEFAHRVAWELEHGPIPADRTICHHCDNPPCVRPDHIYLGSPATNAHDRDSRGRHEGIHFGGGVARGEIHGKAKLTETQVRTIRERRANGERLVVLAAEYGLTHAGISAIVMRRTWRHI